MFELIGPHAPQLVARVLNADLAELQDHQLLDPQVTDDLWLARTVGSGLRAFGPPDVIKELWQRLAAAGARPIGSETWEVLRVEQGLPRTRARADPRLQPLGSRAWPRYSSR